MFSFDYMKKDDIIAKVTVSDDNIVSVINYTDNIVDRPFGTCINPTLNDLDNLFLERCFPSARFNAKQVLQGKLYGYDPLRIIHDTHGILVDDYYWIRFANEDLCWNDVKHWKFHNV